MTILIAPDIFGVTPALTRLAGLLVQTLEPETIKIVDPYGDQHHFRQEEDAYTHFSAHVGIPTYGQLIRNYLADLQPPLLLIGFSAGASAIWHISNDNTLPDITRAICFYGSQIRHDTQLNPGFDTHLIFPESESHFDVDSLIQALGSTPKTVLTKSAGGHGFMNEYSRNFDPSLYHRFLQTNIPKLFTLKQQSRDKNLGS